MITRTFKTLTTRPVLVLAAFLLGMMLYAASGSVFAQEADDPCKMMDDAVECSYEENTPVTMPVADFSAMDPEQEGIEWAVEGLDAGLFEITGGVLTFKKSPNFEMPADKPRTGVEDDDQTPDIVETVIAETGADNVYLVTVKATELLAEGQDPPALSSPLYVTVTVTDVEEPGSIDLTRLQPQVGVEIGADLSDPDRGPANTTEPTGPVWLWSVPKVSRPVIDNENHWQAAGLSTSTTSGTTYTPDAVDDGDVLRVMVTYTDAEGGKKAAYKLSYHAVRVDPTSTDPPGVNTAPVYDEATINLKIPEDAAVGTVVGAPIAATDGDQGDIITYVLTDGNDPGADNGFFKINKMTGQLTIATMLNAERATNDGGDSYQVTVTAYDPSNEAGDDQAATVNITATDVNEAPTVETAETPAEMLKVNENHLVMNLEEDDTETPDINESTDAVVLGTYNPMDPDVGDGDGTPDNTDASEVKLSLDGDDADQFVLGEPRTSSPNTGFRELRFKASPNFESPTDANQDNAYKVTIVATDKKDLTGERPLTINVMNMDEDGTVTLSTIQPGVGQEITAMLTDPDMGTTGMKWQWSRSKSDVDTTFEEIDGATSASYTPAAPVEDDPATLGINEEDPGDEGMYLRVTVKYRDNASPKKDISTTPADDSKALNEEFSVTSDNAVRAVPDVNNAPAFDSATMTREVNENETGNVGEPVTAVDPDGDSLDYTKTGGADMGSFDVVLGSGQITVKEGTDLNAEGDQTSYEVEVTAADPFGKTDATMVTIMVMNVNEAPEFKAKDPEGYDENGDGPVAMFTATDPEGADVEWSVEGLDKADFLIDASGVLTFAKSPNYESPTDDNRDEVEDDPSTENIDETVVAEMAMDNDYLVTIVATEVRAADAEGETKSSTQDITVTVRNLEEPGSIDLSRLQPQTGEELMGMLSDPDNVTENTVTWQWSVPKVSRPEIDNENHWTDAATTGDVADTYTAVAANESKVLRVKAEYTDGEGADKKAYKVSYHAVRQDPEGTTPPGTNTAPIYDETTIPFSIPENADVGTFVGTPVTATDGDQGDVITYELTDDTGETGDDDEFFKINKMTGQLTVDAKLNAERETGAGGDTYVVVVTAYDPSNALGDTRAATVTITVTDVNEAPTVDDSDPAGVSSVPENHLVNDVEDVDPDTPGDQPGTAVVLGTFDATDEDIGDGTDGTTADSSQLRLSLGGEDSGDFKLGDPDADGARELTFKESPDFESPADANLDNAYKVSIVATDKKGLKGTKDLTIRVINMDEDGEVTLSTIQPGVGQAITATLTDPDMGTTGAKWQWYRSDTSGGTQDEIDGATSASYTPAPRTKDNPATLGINEADPGDEGMFLHVTVDYRDNGVGPGRPHDSGRRVQGPEPDAVGDV